MRVVHIGFILFQFGTHTLISERKLFVEELQTQTKQMFKIAIGKEFVNAINKFLEKCKRSWNATAINILCKSRYDKYVTQKLKLTNIINIYSCRSSKIYCPSCFRIRTRYWNVNEFPDLFLNCAPVLHRILLSHLPDYRPKCQNQTKRRNKGHVAFSHDYYHPKNET